MWTYPPPYLQRDSTESYSSLRAEVAAYLWLMPCQGFTVFTNWQPATWKKNQSK